MAVQIAVHNTSTAAGSCGMLSEAPAALIPIDWLQFQPPKVSPALLNPAPVATFVVEKPFSEGSDAGVVPVPPLLS